MPSRIVFHDESGRPLASIARPPQARRRKAVIPAPLRRLVVERDGGVCLHCGTSEDLTADHILPESLGGPATLDNLQTLCRSCNSRKGART